MRISVNPRVWSAIVLVLLVGVTAAFCLMQFDSKGVDSGVAACQGIADKALNPQSPTPKSSASKSTSTPMSEDSYRKNRAVYENSRYSDLKVAGTAVIDIVYDMSNGTGKDVSSNLANYNTLKDNWAALQRACANHDVKIPSL